MQSAFRKIGNSAGVTVPRAVMREANLTIGTKVDFVVVPGGVMMRPVAAHPRAGWAEAAALVAAAPEGDDEAAWRGFGNADDVLLEW